VISAGGYLFAAGAAFVAGGINAIAGGGTLVSFPALLALGVAPVTSNATNTVALCLGHVGGGWAQRKELTGWGAKARPLLIVGAIGGLMGSILLVIATDRVFSFVVPILILLACALLGFQRQIRARLGIGTDTTVRPVGVAVLVGVFAASVYGGYFGAGLGIMLLAVLGVLLSGTLASLNALKSVLSLAINLSAAAFLSLSGHVHWGLAGVMAITGLAGGFVGGRFVSRVDPIKLRRVVVTFGVLVAVRLAISAFT
jgi:uncharacterized protein